MGGEPLKAQLLAHKIGYPKALATVAVHRHAEVASQGIFLALGIGITLTHFRVPSGRPDRGALAGCSLLGGMTLWMTCRAPARRLRRGPRVARALSVRSTACGGSRGRRSGLDVLIGDFYERRQEHFLGSVAGASWAGAAACSRPTSCCACSLRARAGGRAVAIESLALALNNVALLIPARLGIAEGVRVGVFLLLGLSAAQGAAYSVARRARELLWLIPGLVVLLKHHLLDLRHMHLSEMHLDEEVAP